MVLYADGPTMEVSIDVDATRATVWELVSDIEMPIRFSKDLYNATLGRALDLMPCRATR